MRLYEWITLAVAVVTLLILMRQELRHRNTRSQFSFRGLRVSTRTGKVEKPHEFQLKNIGTLAATALTAAVINGVFRGETALTTNPYLAPGETWSLPVIECSEGGFILVYWRDADSMHRNRRMWFPLMSDGEAMSLWQEQLGWSRWTRLRMLIKHRGDVGPSARLTSSLPLRKEKPERTSERQSKKQRKRESRKPRD